MSDISQIKEALERAISIKNKKSDDELRAKLMTTVGADIVSSLSPLLKELSGSKNALKEELKSALREVRIESPEVNPNIEVNVPDIIIPDIQVPEPKVTVNVPRIEISDIVSRIKMPEEMDIRGWVQLQGVDLGHPLPVQLRDKDGKPVNLFENLTTLVSGGGGGVAHIVKVSSIVSTTVVIGDIVSDTLDIESAPIKVGGIARTANPTAVTAGDRVSATYDDVGRQITYPYQVRDLISTARVSLTTGTETTLLAGAAGVFLDLLYITGINTSTNAQTLDIRDNLTGGIITQLRMSGGGEAHHSFPVPLPQNEAGNSWTIDMGDDTNSTIDVSAIFVRNV